MAHDEPQVVLNKGDDVGPINKDDTTFVQPKDATSLDYSGNGQTSGHGVPEYVGHAHNEVLEEEAQTKGRWFQYVKTKQFWLVLLLGQGI